MRRKASKELLSNVASELANRPVASTEKGSPAPMGDPVLTQIEAFSLLGQGAGARIRYI
jgi:hypothetical protein